MFMAVQKALTTDRERPSPHPFKCLLLIKQRLLICLKSAASSLEATAWMALSIVQFNASFCAAHKGPWIPIPSPPETDFAKNTSPVPIEPALTFAPRPPTHSRTPNNAPLILLTFSSEFNYFTKPLLLSASNSACSAVSSSTC